MMTPRTPRSPHAHPDDALHSPLFMHTPHTPTTPLYLLSPSAADAAGTHAGGHAVAEASAAVGQLPLEGADLESLQALVAEQVAAVLGSAVGADEPLMAAGLDSLGATELQQSLADCLGLELPSTLVFDYPTVNAMAEFLAGRLAPAGAAAAGPAAAALLPASALAGPAGGAGWAVAMVGAAGHGELAGRRLAGDASGRVPYARWDADSPLITGDGSLAAQVGAGCFCLLWLAAGLTGGQANAGTARHHSAPPHQQRPPFPGFRLSFFTAPAVWRVPARRGAV